MESVTGNSNPFYDLACRYAQAVDIWRETDDVSYFIVLFILYSFVALILGGLVHAGYNRKKYGRRKATA